MVVAGTRRNLVVAIAALLSLLTVALQPDAASASSAAASGAPLDWYGALAFYRATAGLAPPAHHGVLSAYAFNHGRYMVCSGHFAHHELPGPHYTPEGNHAAHFSNIAVGPQGRSGRDWIEGWMTAPFHAIAMLDPRLVYTGFGLAEAPPGDPCYGAAPWGAGAALDVHTFKDPNIPLRAMTWPGHETRVPLQAFRTETPDPRSNCPGGPAPWQGLPMLAFFSTPAAGAVMSLDGPNGPVPMCTITAESYWHPDLGSQQLGQAIMASRNAAVGMPLPVLAPGVYHLVALNGTGEALSSWFEILPEGS